MSYTKESTDEHRKLNRAVLDEINRIRKQPKAYATHVQKYIDTFKDGSIFLEGMPVGIYIEEGLKVLKEAKKFLTSHPGYLKSLEYNACLEKAALDHYLDIAPKGLTTHKSSDGKGTYKDRIEKYAKWGGSIFEAILYGKPRPSARDIVLAWVIDDGFESRCHRKNIFFGDHGQFAMVTGPHSSAEFCFISLFAAQIIPLEKAMDSKKAEQENVEEFKQSFLRDKDWEAFSKEVFNLQNKVRANPKCMISYLEKCLGRFKGKTLYSADEKSYIVTEEGRQAYIEAIEFLRKQKPQKRLAWQPDLVKAAQDHLEDIGPKGVVSSMGTNGSSPPDRISKYGRIDETWAESNIFGALSANEVLERLLVCDGQPTRGFRKSVFNDQLYFCGVSSGPHSTHDNMVQIEYVKKLLGEGELPTITLQVEAGVPKDLLQKLDQLGIDQSKIKVIDSSTGKKPSLKQYLNSTKEKEAKQGAIKQDPSTESLKTKTPPVAATAPKKFGGSFLSSSRGSFVKQVPKRDLKLDVDEKPSKPIPKPIGSTLSCSASRNKYLNSSSALKAAASSTSNLRNSVRSGLRPSATTLKRPDIATSLTKPISSVKQVTSTKKLPAARVPPMKIPPNSSVLRRDSSRRSIVNKKIVPTACAYAYKSTQSTEPVKAQSQLKTPTQLSEGSPKKFVFPQKSSSKASDSVKKQESPLKKLLEPSISQDQPKRGQSLIGQGVRNASPKKSCLQESKRSEVIAKPVVSYKPMVEKRRTSEAVEESLIKDYEKKSQQQVMLSDKACLLQQQTIEFHEDSLIMDQKLSEVNDFTLNLQDSRIDNPRHDDTLFSNADQKVQIISSFDNEISPPEFISFGQNPEGKTPSLPVDQKSDSTNPTEKSHCSAASSGQPTSQVIQTPQKTQPTSATKARRTRSSRKKGGATSAVV